MRVGLLAHACSYSCLLLLQAVAKPSCARELEPLCAALSSAVGALPPPLAGAPPPPPPKERGSIRLCMVALP